MAPFLYPSIQLLKLKTALEYFNNTKEKLSHQSSCLEIPSGYYIVPAELTFCDQRIIGGFQITVAQEYYNELITAHIISKKRMSASIGTYLGKGFGSSTRIKINDYRRYKELKQQYFLGWLLEKEFFEGVKMNRYRKPTVVCFGGRLSDPLMTPLASHFGQKKDIRIYAVKFNDAVYLWSEKHRKEKSTFFEDRMAYYGIYFEHLLTKRNQQRRLKCKDNNNSTINENEKSFIIQEITLGQHQILCLNEIDAVNDKNELVEIKLHGPFTSSLKRFGRYLQYWAQSVVSGVKLLVIGERNSVGLLTSIDTETVKSVGEKFGLRLANCYDFENKWLDFICGHFKDNDPKIVKKFTWSFDGRQVIATDVEEELIPFYLLPPWYVEAVGNPFPDPSPKYPTISTIKEE